MNAAIRLMPDNGYQRTREAREAAIAALAKHPTSRMKQGAVRALTHLLLAMEVVA